MTAIMSAASAAARPRPGLARPGPGPGPPKGVDVPAMMLERDTVWLKLILGGWRGAAAVFSWCFRACGRFLWPLIPARGQVRVGGYGVDVPAMSLELHERGIHAV